MFHVRNKDHWFFTFLQAIAFVDHAACAQPQYPLQLINHGGHAEPCSDDYICVGGMYMFFDFFMCQVVRQGHQGAGFAGFGVGVADIWPNLFGNYFLDGLIKPSAGYPVSINHFYLAIRRVDHEVVADNVFFKFRKMLFQGCHVPGCGFSECYSLF